MSKFAIYKSEGSSLKTIGLINKLIYVFIALLFPILGFFGALSSRFKVSDAIIFFTLTFWLISIVTLVLFSRHINKNLKQLGELRITLNGITKSDGGLFESYDFNSVKELKVKKHIRTIFFSLNSDSSKTYLITIIRNDSKKEQFVVSSQSISSPNVNLLDTLKKLNKQTKNLLINTSV